MKARLGKYEIAEVLGKGAMGVVYRAFDPLIRRTVALKTIRKELLDDDDLGAVERFRNEAQAAGRLSHPGIVAIHDYGEDSELAYIAMEFVDGVSLREYFQKDVRFTAEESVGLTVQLLEALQYAHGQGVWHRDIKPANLMITTRGQLKIADFGIARVDGTSLTVTGAVIGSPGYMAPEQYQGGDIDWRVDLFAAGVVLYQLLTGEKPFTGTSDQISYHTCFKDPALPSVLRPGAGLERYNAPVWKALSKTAAKRFQSAEAFRDALVRMHGTAPPAVLAQDRILLKAPVDEDATNVFPARGTASERTDAGTAESSSQSPTQVTPSTSLVPPGWTAEQLKEVETHLAPSAGPVARVLVRRAASGTTDLARLYEVLAADIENERERGAFLATRAKMSTPVAAPPTIPPKALPPAPAPGAGAIPGEVVDNAARCLAVHLGPIARVMARKAARQASDPADFHRRLAEQLHDDRERERFFADVAA